MPPGPLTALYGTWIMLRMAKPMLTRARAKAKKRSSRIVTWRPALSSFTRCGKTGKRRHSQYFSIRAGLKFIESRPAYPRGFNWAERARQVFKKQETSWGEFMDPRFAISQLANNPLFLAVEAKSECAPAATSVALTSKAWDLVWASCTQAPDGVSLAEEVGKRVSQRGRLKSFNLVRELPSLNQRGRSFRYICEECRST